MVTLFLVFLKIGFLGFGGGYAMLSLIFEDAMTLGLSVSQFADLNALDMLAPGPIAINSATYVGYITQGFWGALIATLAVSVSSFVFSHFLLKYEAQINENKILARFLYYAKIAAVGMIASVALKLCIEAIMPESLSMIALVSVVVAFVMRFKFKVNPLLVIGVCGTMSVVIVNFV